MIALYPIKPKYTDKIISGEKKYELRKRLPNVNVDHVLIYSTYPISKIIGYAEIKAFHSSSVQDIWNLVSEKAGIDLESYNQYFSNVEVACALEFDKVFIFKRPFHISDISEKMTVPQSFCYINRSIFLKLKKRRVVLV